MEEISWTALVKNEVLQKSRGWYITCTK